MKATISAYTTPGIRLIVSFLLKVSLPSHLLYRAVRHCLPKLDAHLGWGCYTLLGSLMLFLLHILYTHLLSFYHLHRARLLHAQPLPSVSGRWPGNFDLMRQWLGIWQTGYPGDIAGRIMNQLGGVQTYGVKLFWHDTAFTADPEIIREILTTDHANYIKGRQLTDAFHSVLGSGVFNTNGDLWRFHRSMSRPFFTRDRLKRIVPTFVKHADHALQLLEHRMTNAEKEGSLASEGGVAGGAVDMQDLASRFTLDAATEFLFGGCVQSLNEPLPAPWNAAPAPPLSTTTPPQPLPPSRSSSQDSVVHILPLNHPHGILPPPDSPSSSSSSSFSTSSTSSSSPQTKETTTTSTTTATRSFPSAFTSALHTLAARLRSGSLWPLLEITKDSTRKDVKVIQRFVREIVVRALARREQRDRKEFGLGPSSSLGEKESSDASTSVETLLDHLITVSDDIQLIQDELINILIAGRDTTASCITFATYMLSQHPSVLERLEREVLSVLGSTRAPELDDFRSMPYLRAVINETLRLFPSVPFNVRESLAERVWVDREGQRWYVPAGTSVTYSCFHLHRAEGLWGPSCQEFDPQRFLQEDGRYERYYGKSPFVFVPFNAGPRSCLGQQLAYAEVEVFLCRMVQRLVAKASGGTRRRVVLDEDAIPLKARVPRVWSEEQQQQQQPKAGARRCSVVASVMRRFSSSDEEGEATAKEGRVEEGGGGGLPFHSTGRSNSSSSSIGMGMMGMGTIPAATVEGVSPRRAVEKVWPKSHLTMYVEGGLWVRTVVS
ncbi:hypothetical protein FRC17_002007 [Serendipita sp. 399]|nr:hypothetical protein FRC17_002007 [Serendipita sp. 399]